MPRFTPFLLASGILLTLIACSNKALNVVPGTPIEVPISKNRPAWTSKTELDTRDGKIWIVGRSSGMKIEAAAIESAEMNARSRFAARIYTRIRRKASQLFGHELGDTNHYFNSISLEASNALATGMGESGGQLLHIERFTTQPEAGGRFQGYFFDVWVAMNISQDRYRFAMNEALGRIRSKVTDEESRKLIQELEKEVKSGEFEKQL